MLSITRKYPIPRPTRRFADLKVGDIFRYLNATSDENVYIKTRDNSYRPNAVALWSGKTYEIGYEAEVVKQDAQLTVRDDRS